MSQQKTQIDYPYYESMPNKNNSPPIFDNNSQTDTPFTPLSNQRQREYYQSDYIKKSGVYQVTENSAEKDLLISQLRNQIQILQSNQKEFDLITVNHQKMLFDYNVIFEQKRKNEFDINNLNTENALLKNEYNELKENLLCKIKEKDNHLNKLIDDNSHLNMVIENMGKSIEDLQKALMHQEEQNHMLNRVNENLDKSNSELSKTISDLNFKINSLQEKEKLLNKKTSELDMLSKEHTHTKAKLENSQYETISKEKEMTTVKSEYNLIEQDLNHKHQELKVSAERQDKMFEDNIKLYEELEYMKNQVLALVDQNKYLIDELEAVKEEYNIIDSQLQRRENINSLCFLIIETKLITH